VALGQNSDLVCMESATGKVLWQHNLKSELKGKMMSGWGYSESPLIDGGLVVCTPGGAGGTLAAFDKKTGKLAWRSAEWTDSAAYSSVVPATIGGVRQYIQLTEASVAGVAAADGKLLWRASRKGGVAVIPTPIVSDGCVYVTSGYGAGCNLFKVTSAGGKFAVEQVYADGAMANHHGGVIKVGDFVYGHSDKTGWICQDFKTGAVKWQEKGKLAKGALAYADGRLYLRAESGAGTVALIEASPEGFREHGRFDQPDRSSKNSWPHPVIAGGRLYLRDQDVLLCYDVKAN
jgi:outer membrane protein assembly factor BamB